MARRNVQDEDIKAIEEYLRRIEERHRKHVDEEEQKRREAIEFLKQHTFILGPCNGEKSETDAILKYQHRIWKLQQHYGFKFHAFAWDGQIIAIPAELRAQISINIKELLPHAKRFGETLAFFVEG